MIVAFRSQTLMPLDDSLFAPQPIIPRLRAMVEFG